ncbi:MAG: putative acyltransferase [Acidimicrobiia bacterium]|nr:putative acyltransferase [Acidimicrobiia bacterium]
MTTSRASAVAALLVGGLVLMSACSDADQLSSSPSTTKVARHGAAPVASSSSSVASTSTSVTASSSPSTTVAPSPGTAPSALAPPDALFPTSPTDPTSPSDLAPAVAPRLGPPAVSTGPAFYRPVPTTAAARLLTTTSVGDSVMLAAQGELTVLGFDVDALKNRTFEQGLDELRSIRSAGHLGDRVIVHLGTNGGVTDDQMNRLGVTLDGVARVCVVTVAGGQWAQSANPLLVSGARRFRFSIIDWAALVAAHPDVVGPDGIHLAGTTGPGDYAGLLSSC